MPRHNPKPENPPVHGGGYFSGSGTADGPEPEAFAYLRPSLERMPDDSAAPDGC